MTRTFFGRTPQSLFKKQICLKVVASDGYYQKADIFCIHLNIIPPMLFISYAISLLSPFAGALGLYKYKG